MFNQNSMHMFSVCASLPQRQKKRQEGVSERETEREGEEKKRDREIERDRKSERERSHCCCRRYHFQLHLYKS